MTEEKRLEAMNMADFKWVVDNAYDEIFVYDSNYRVVYVNKACERHYGMKSADMIGKNFWDLAEEEIWFPSVLPTVYEEKRRMTIKQVSYLGVPIITTAVPLFDERGEIKYVIMSVRDQLFELDLIREEMEKSRSLNGSLDTAEPEAESETMKRFISRSRAMTDLLDVIQRIAKVDSTILLQGESGTGKGMLARHIHEKSLRVEHPFLTINCAAIPEALLESELFGYTEGAFTGAQKKGKVGLIEMAQNGTLFLDEIGELSLGLQSKLLHVIQDREFLPVGGRTFKSVDVRILAATNRNLLEMVEEKSFREDLYYRLNVLELDIPPLRDRPEDIIALSQYYLNHFNGKYEQSREFSDELTSFFLRYSWPGNVRQLENAIERLVLTAKQNVLRIEDLPKRFHDHIAPSGQIAMNYETAKEQFEAELTERLYPVFNTSRKLAERLGVSQSKANRMIRKLKGRAAPGKSVTSPKEDL